MRVVWPSLFICNLILMHFFKVISFYLEISYMIIQCLRTVTLVDICSDLICLQTQWFSTDVLWKFSGNGQRRPFSVSCNNVLLQIFSLVESCCIEIRGLLPATLQKELLQVSFLGISRTNTFQRCIQTNQTFKMEFIAKIVCVVKSLDCFL